jgi:hypothetical protein
MESQTLILGLVIVALSLLFVAWPFIIPRRDKSAPANGKLNGELERLLVEREAMYAAIRDLDFDFETGKLTDEDHQQQRAAWVARGVDILKALDALQQQVGERGAVAVPERAVPAGDDDLDAQIEAAVASRRRTV